MPSGTFRTVLAVDDLRVILWAATDLAAVAQLHVEPSCPAATGPGSWREFPVAAVATTCTVCASRRLSVQYSGTATQVATARLAMASDVIVSATAPAAVGDVKRLLEAHYALVTASTSARELGITSSFHAAKHTLAELRRVHQATFEHELARRALTSSPRATTTTPASERRRSTWRAVRWAVRHGVDPVAASRHLAPANGEVEAHLAEIDSEAARLCATDHHLLLAATRSLPSGVLTELIASSGALGDLLGEAGAVVLPAGIVELLSTPYPGMHVANAGAIEVSLATPELLALVAQLWRGDAGVLSDARTALAVARGLQS